MKQGQVYFWLVCLVLIQGLLLTVGNVSQYWINVFPSFNVEQWRLAQGFFVGGSILYSLFLIKNLVRASDLEAEMKAQATQMANITELIRTMRAQRHDFVNHVQALYGLIKAGNAAEALRYVETVYGEVKQGSQVLQLGEPEMIALLQAKMGEAEAKGIRLVIRVDPRFRTIAVAPKDLNRIIGNLMNNAFEAVEAAGAGDRWTEVDLVVEKDSFKIEVANGGEISETVRRRLFQPAFSTKTAGGHQGLGLYAVETLAGRYGGRVGVESGKGRTVFTVTLPILKGQMRGEARGQRA